jgi:phosphoribosyl 1,2-cyclic phosphodiesterase
MEIRFWGVRGSVPWATAASIGYGCNTPCIEIGDRESSAFLILDAGSGIVSLGETLVGPPRELPILLTHYHWDHLQGLPFFAPFHQPGWSPSIWAPALAGADPGWLETVFGAPFFAVSVTQLCSPPSVTVIRPGSVHIGGFRILAEPITHPGGAFAYRVNAGAKGLVYATDHEFGDVDADERLAALALNTDALVLDAHFTPGELTTHQGWGHSSWRQAAEFASAVGARRLWLFHHKPGRSDAELVELEARARRIFPATSAAREGKVYEV